MGNLSNELATSWAGETSVAPDASALTTLMEELRQGFADAASLVAANVTILLNKLRGLSFGIETPIPRQELFKTDDIPALAIFLGALSDPFDAIDSSGTMGKPQRWGESRCAMPQWFGGSLTQHTTDYSYD